MWKVVLKRFLVMIPQLFILSVLVFGLAKLMPGDPFSGLAENPKISQEQIEAIRQASGFYEPWYQQYLTWLKNFMHGDFGLSYTTGKSVGTLLGERIFNTFNLSLFTAVIMYAIAIPMGMYAGRYNGSKFDKFVNFYNFFFLAIPSFVLYLFMIALFGFGLGWFPTSGSVDVNLDPGTFTYYINKLQHLILPGICLALLSTVFIRINGVSELVNALLIIFGGGLLPLDLYPKLLLRISEITPFYAVMYAPISIIVHDNDLGKVLFILGVQMFWLIILLIISKRLSRYVFNKFDIMGG